MKPEPLGKNHTYVLCSSCSRKSWHEENIKSAVEWLKQKHKKMLTRGLPGAQKEWDELIDKAFVDVIGKNESETT